MSRARPLVVGVVGVGMLVVAAATVTFLALHQAHARRTDARARTTEVNAGPRVVVATAKPASPQIQLVLQGEVRPYLQTTIYAKLQAFASAVDVDRGDRVRAGQVLARLVSPETDRQVLAAHANTVNLQQIAARQVVLAKQQLVAVQDADQAVASARTAAETELQLAALADYEIVRAPFDGVITARYADPGALLAPTTPLLAIAQTDHLRVFAYVDQRDAGSVRIGDEAQLGFPGDPSRVVAHVTRTAEALDPQTRMLLVEVDLDNAEQRLAGGFVDVWLTVDAPPAVEVPADALISRAGAGGATLVAIVDAQGVVHFQPVEVARNDGKTARLTHGVDVGASVAVGLGQTVPDGAQVRPIAQQPTSSSSR